MAPISLVLEASTPSPSVAIVDGDRLLVEHTTVMRAAAGERLLPAIDECLRETGMSLAQIDRIVCGAGPGGFTSLRIAGSLAKGFAVGCAIPLYAVPSHLLTIASVNGLIPGYYLVVNDAMRGEWFVSEAEQMEGEGPMLRGGTTIAAREALAERARIGRARVIGPGAESISSDGIPAEPRAKAVARLGRYVDGLQPVDLSLWEPVYGRLAEAQVKWEAAHGRALG